MPTIGYTSSTTVMLDLDNLGLEEVRYWAHKISEEFKLNGFLILESSQRHHHVVFDRSVSPLDVIGIVAHACLDTKNVALIRWFILQCRKEEFTLRISPKGDKPRPRIAYRYGKQNREIRRYLQYRRLIRSIRLPIVSEVGEVINEE
jgi:hypothetical protein